MGDRDMSSTGRDLQDHSYASRLVHLPLKSPCVIAEYIWITRYPENFNLGVGLRSKARVLDIPLVETLADLPEWSADGLSTNQGSADTRLPYLTEIILKPVYFCPDPFRGSPHILVLTEAVYSDGTWPPSNCRRAAAAALLAAEKKVGSVAPWFGWEQEYALMQADKRTLVGWPQNGQPIEQVELLNYCGLNGGTVNHSERLVMESHVRACLAADLDIAGWNLEVLVGSCEFQLGVTQGVAAADELWMSRYILARVAEEFGYHVSLNPKPVYGCDGCGLHTNFSTAKMRANGGYDVILQAVCALQGKHTEHLAVYGENSQRLKKEAGDEYSGKDSLTWGVGERSASIRIPFPTFRAKRGYFEDRRPASNADPYKVVTRMIQTVLLDPQPNIDSLRPALVTSGFPVDLVPLHPGLPPPTPKLVSRVGSGMATGEELELLGTGVTGGQGAAPGEWGESIILPAAAAAPTGTGTDAGVSGTGSAQELNAARLFNGTAATGGSSISGGGGGGGVGFPPSFLQGGGDPYTAGSFLRSRAAGTTGAWRAGGPGQGTGTAPLVPSVDIRADSSSGGLLPATGMGGFTSTSATGLIPSSVTPSPAVPRADIVRSQWHTGAGGGGAVRGGSGFNAGGRVYASEAVQAAMPAPGEGPQPKPSAVPTGSGTGATGGVSSGTQPSGSSTTEAK